MLATAFLTNPPQPFPTFIAELKPRKIISYTASTTSGPVFSEKIVSRKSGPVKNRGWRPNTMAESIETRVSIGGTADNCIAAAAFDQEALIDGSSELRPNQTAGWLDTNMNRLGKWFVAVIFAAIILTRHDAEALWFGMGSVWNVGLSNTLKQILNQERPVSALSSGPGMPSSHAQSIFFFAVFVILSMVEWLGLNGLTTILSGLVLALCSYLSWLRVSLHYHTISQVAVGAVMGFIFSILWFWTWNAIVLKAFTSYLWVRIVVVLGAACFCLGFLLHVVR